MACDGTRYNKEIEEKICITENTKLKSVKALDRPNCNICIGKYILLKEQILSEKCVRDASLQKNSSDTTECAHS